MLCKKCKKEIPDGSKFCNHCGAKQVRERSAKKRGNGQGTVYKDKNGKWIAEYTIGWDSDEEGGKLNRKKRKKRGAGRKDSLLQRTTRYYVGECRNSTESEICPRPMLHRNAFE